MRGEGVEHVCACVYHHIHTMVILNNDQDEVYVKQNGIHQFIFITNHQNHKPVNMYINLSNTANA